jgi:hypothetical protein
MSHDPLQLMTADGSVTLRFDPAHLHDNGAPKRLICVFELNVDGTAYMFSVGQRITPAWDYLPLPPGCYEGNLIVITAKGRRCYADWSKKALELRDRNLDSLRAYFDDPGYREQLVNAIVLPWLEDELAKAEAREFAKSEARRIELARLRATQTRERLRGEDGVRRLRERLERQQEIASALV